MSRPLSAWLWMRLYAVRVGAVRRPAITLTGNNTYSVNDIMESKKDIMSWLGFLINIHEPFGNFATEAQTRNEFRRHSCRGGLKHGALILTSPGICLLYLLYI